MSLWRETEENVLGVVAPHLHVVGAEGRPSAKPHCIVKWVNIEHDALFVTINLRLGSSGVTLSIDIARRLWSMFSALNSFMANGGGPPSSTLTVTRSSSSSEISMTSTGCLASGIHGSAGDV
jgi:hypothetical protein